MAPCMLNYMTDIMLVQVNPDESIQLEVRGKGN